ncbi:MAG: hypothetical protein ACPGO5_01185 [Patescibacteria group bacterium]
MDSISPQKKCSLWIKIVFTISLLFNIVVIGFLGFAYYEYRQFRVLYEPSEVSDITQPRGDQDSLLNTEQEAMLESVGIDPALIPTTITPELENCLRDAVGEERSAAIEAGAQPTTAELLQAAQCL